MGDASRRPDDRCAATTVLTRVTPAVREPRQVRERRRILWLDDEICDDGAEARYLRELGLEVSCVQRAEAALARLESESFDAILLDLHMPDKSGLDVLEDLTQRKNRVPVVLLTGYGTMERAVAAMKLGAVDVLSKPVDVDELAARLREVRARYPDGADPPSITEAEWVRVQCERLSDCINREDAIAVVVRLLLSGRVTLRYFHGCANALRLLLTSEEVSRAVLTSQARAAILSSLRAPWPTDPQMVSALTLLEGDAKKQSQRVFAQRSGLSRSYLSRKLFKLSGRHASDWCRAAVLREGLRRLATTPDPVSAIAYDLGYLHSQFDRDIVTTVGLAPRILRRRLLTTSCVPREHTQC